MKEQLYVPVFYEGKEMYFEANILPYSAVPWIEVNVFGRSILFERDELTNHWTLLNSNNEQAKELNSDLLMLIATSLNSLLK
jgi:hypothetical protein